MVIELEKAIQKNYKDLEITIDPALIEEFNQQTDQTGRDAVLDKIKETWPPRCPPHGRINGTPGGTWRCSLTPGRISETS